MYSLLGLFFNQSCQKDENPGNSCAQFISLKQQRELDQNWQNFDRQLFWLKAQF